MSEMKNIGISFEFSREYLNHFAQLFEKIDVKNYTWHVSCSENFLSSNEGVQEFLPDGIYSGNEFADIIHSTSAYYIHLICLFAVPTGCEFSSKTIVTYEDFTKSPAEIALLSGDSYVDMYAKNIDTLDALWAACQKYYNSGTIPLEYITPQNYARTKFEV